MDSEVLAEVVNESLLDNQSSEVKPSSSEALPLSIPNPLSSRTVTMPPSDSLSPTDDSSSSLKEAALKVGTSVNKLVDPNTILVWMDVIKSVLRMCPRSAEQLQAAGRRQSIFDRRILVQKLMHKFPSISRNEAINRAYQMFDAIAVAKTDEIEKLLEEIHND